MLKLGGTILTQKQSWVAQNIEVKALSKNHCLKNGFKMTDLVLCSCTSLSLCVWHCCNSFNLLVLSVGDHKI